MEFQDGGMPMYKMQTGGMPMYSMQSGGGLFGSLFRMIVPAIRTAAKVAVPAIKSVAKTAAKDLLAAGVTTGLEALEGHDPAESASRNLKRAAASSLHSVLEPERKKKKSLNTSKIRRKRKNHSKHAF